MLCLKQLARSLGALQYAVELQFQRSDVHKSGVMSEKEPLWF